MNEFAAYYTESSVSDLLVSQLCMGNAEKILDLGAGGGSLLGAALKRWPNSAVTAAEVNPHGCRELRQKFPHIRLVETDGLQADSCPKLLLKPESIDVAVCNPPYLRVEETTIYKELFSQVGLLNIQVLKNLTTDVVFLAQNLRLLRQGGELGIILPDSIVTAKGFQSLRSGLIKNHEIFGVIQMPDNIFKGTEALTHILLIRRGGMTKNSVPIFRADKNMHLEDKVEVNNAELVKRMDFTYWHWRNSKTLSNPMLTLNDIGAEIFRGGISHKTCKELGVDYFHTCHIPDNKGQSIYFNSNDESRYRTLENRDILLARVGTRCIGRVAIIRSGSRLYTDCVYRIRVPKVYVKQVLSSFISTEGQDWLKAHAHGVCAKVISKSDLMNFPLL